MDQTAMELVAKRLPNTNVKPGAVLRPTTTEMVKQF
jgi:hypothetical protein